MMSAMSETLSPRQRRHFQETVQDMVDDLDTLAEQLEKI
jgi:hypothetical protein